MPSIHGVTPHEEGGPVARAGFNYQDEISVSLFLDLLEFGHVECIHCETHDDAVVIYADSRVEHVQVKSHESFAAWTLAALTARDGDKVGSSIFEKSLARDRFEEVSTFRIVTLRDVAPDLVPLKFPRSRPGREAGNGKVKALRAELDKRCPNAESPKGNDSSYWLENCLWDVRESEQSIARHNFIRVIELSAKQGYPLLPESAHVLLDELRKLAKVAGGAKWETS